MKPHQIISLMTFDGADNTLSLPDHADHIHVGFQPLDGRRQGRPSAQRVAQAQPVDQAHRPTEQDREPDGVAAAVEVRAEGALSAPEAHAGESLSASSSSIPRGGWDEGGRYVVAVTRAKKCGDRGLRARRAPAPLARSAAGGASSA